MSRTYYSCGLLVAALAAALPAAAGARTQHYAAPLDRASWELEEAPGACGLRHEIPGVGFVRFHQASGQRLSFEFHAQQPPVRAGQLQLVSRPPAWQHGGDERVLGRFDYRRGMTPLRFGRDLALRLYYELEQGMSPELRYSDWADGRDPTAVTLSNIRFLEVAPAFQQCITGLVQLDFDAVAEQSIHFRTDSAYLDHRARKLLEAAIRRFRNDDRVEKIVIAGHADQRGATNYNELLSRQRAEVIKLYLQRRGVPADRIEVRHFGERWPVDPANNATAWARNRRATVWLAHN